MLFHAITGVCVKYDELKMFRQHTHTLTHTIYIYIYIYTITEWYFIGVFTVIRTIYFFVCFSQCIFYVESEYKYIYIFWENEGIRSYSTLNLFYSYALLNKCKLWFFLASIQCMTHIQWCFQSKDVSGPNRRFERAWRESTDCWRCDDQWGVAGAKRVSLQPVVYGDLPQN